MHFVFVLFFIRNFILNIIFVSCEIAFFYIDFFFHLIPKSNRNISNPKIYLYRNFISYFPFLCLKIDLSIFWAFYFSPFSINKTTFLPSLSFFRRNLIEKLSQNHSIKWNLSKEKYSMLSHIVSTSNYNDFCVLKI